MKNSKELRKETINAIAYFIINHGGTYVLDTPFVMRSDTLKDYKVVSMDMKTVPGGLNVIFRTEDNSKSINAVNIRYESLYDFMFHLNEEMKTRIQKEASIAKESFKEVRDLFKSNANATMAFRVVRGDELIDYLKRKANAGDIKCSCDDCEEERNKQKED